MQTSAATIEDTQQLFLTEKQLAARWQLAPKTIQRMVRRGELRPIVISRSPRFSVVDIQRYEMGQPLSDVNSTSFLGNAAVGPMIGADHLNIGPKLPQIRERSHFSVCIAHRKGGVAKTTTL